MEQKENERQTGHSRVLKFRAWNTSDKTMGDSFTLVQAIRARPHYDVSAGVEYMQYTGLKDKNGKEIYEGDIVRFVCTEENYDKVHVIEWKHNGFAVNGWTSHLNDPRTTAEIIGNIYATPNLLN